ncbi:MAG: GDP-mannose 4,6-dehydratase [Deltaproteobacteria bacterium]|nr:GDP-mannose 4,6-dehydratase [Deltaproteobacteria bacterium]
MIAVDLLDKAELIGILKQTRPDYIFHLAGVIFTRDWGEHYRGNVETTVNLLGAVKETGLKTRVVVPGSAAEYGRTQASDLPLVETRLPNPVTPYGVAKVWQTAVVRYYAACGVDAVCGRIFNVIGAGVPQGLSIGAFAEQIRKIKRREALPEIAVGNLSSRRDFIDVVDACRALAALAQSGRTAEVYNVCSGASVSMREVLDMMIKSAGVDVKLTTDPARLKDADIDDSFGSNAKIRNETGWSPVVSLKESVDALVADVLGAL